MSVWFSVETHDIAGWLSDSKFLMTSNIPWVSVTAFDIMQQRRKRMNSHNCCTETINLSLTLSYYYYKQEQMSRSLTGWLSDSKFLMTWIIPWVSVIAFDSMQQRSKTMNSHNCCTETISLSVGEYEEEQMSRSLTGWLSDSKFLMTWIIPWVSVIAFDSRQQRRTMNSHNCCTETISLSVGEYEEEPEPALLMMTVAWWMSEWWIVYVQGTHCTAEPHVQGSIP
jgi:uncharacterized protein involved in propanediol utilization